MLTWRYSAFEPNASTENQLFCIIYWIHAALDDNYDVLIVFLDISKTFDKVHHHGLIHIKLEALIWHYGKSTLHGSEII